MDLASTKSLHFVGIGGIGVSALARLFLSMGKKVSGSDRKESEITLDLRNLGGRISIGHNAENIKGADMIIYSEDITSESEGYVELAYAASQEIPAITYSKALGLVMEGKYGIGITGTNGKSTTTALLGLMLEDAGMDPSVVVGTKLSKINETEKFKANARLGNSKLMVVEADEYHRHMMDNKPSMIVLTNVAEDHLDYYKDLSEIKHAFSDYIHSLPKSGALIYNADDHNAVEVGRQAGCHKFTFGIHHYADLQAINIKVEHAKQFFDMHFKDQFFANIEMQVPGAFNISNALGATLAAIRLGVDVVHITKVLKEFAGTWRRFEKIGEVGRTTIISDYGHHPAGVKETIKAAKEFYPGKNILLVFQPHHRNRTKKLMGEFVESLVLADSILLPEIFDVAGREHGEDVSSKQIVEELVKLKVDAKFTGNLEETELVVKQKIKDFDVIIFMGAGDIDGLARKIATEIFNI